MGVNILWILLGQDAKVLTVKEGGDLPKKVVRSKNNKKITVNCLVKYFVNCAIK